MLHNATIGRYRRLRDKNHHGYYDDYPYEYPSNTPIVPSSQATIYIRAVNIERDGEQYGTYYRAVRSYREKGKVKQEVVHLGEHQTAVAALAA